MTTEFTAVLFHKLRCLFEHLPNRATNCQTDTNWWFN